ncbi:MAG: short-chain dehydrogenase, partial [Candidatus Poribacteria bacterium]|nr:short-chain dehydrogenase [Candidatus Poribacteria bacterium]
NTSTHFADVANADDTKMQKAETPDKVAEVGLEAFLRGRNYVIPGTPTNRLLANLPRLFSRRRAIQIASGIFKPDSPPQEDSK